MTFRSTARRCAAVGAFLLLTACGSSGGGTTTTVYEGEFAPPDLYLGLYRVFGISGSQGGPEEVIATWTDLNVQPDMVIGSGNGNNTGAVGGGGGFAGGNTYFVHGDRRFGTQSDLDKRITSTGGISADGSVAAHVGIAPNAGPGVHLHLRKGSGLDDSILSGTYYFAAFGAQVAGVMTGSYWGRVQLDGMGAGSLLANANIEGVIAPPNNIDLTYAVAANGGVDWTFTGAQTMTGWSTAEGELVVLAGGTMAADDPLLIVMVREGAGYSDASMEGPWFLLGLSQEVGPNSYTSFTGSLLSNGMGAADVQGIANNEGTIDWTMPENVSTSTTANGGLTLTTGGGETWVGGISQSGRFGVLAGPTNAGSDPGIYVLLR